MVGIIGGGLASNITLDALGTDAIESSPEQVFAATMGSAFAGNATPRLARVAGDQINQGIGADEFGRQVDLGQPNDQMLDPASAQDRFGAPGLTFQRPVSEGTARDLYEAQRAKNVRDDVINRRPNGIATGQVAQTAYGFIGGMLDPLNLAAALVPGAGEARVAQLLGSAAERAVGRLAVRAVAGATAGAAGTAALEPLNFALDRAEQQDWHMADALRNIAFGSVLGGGLHVAGGAIGDIAARRRAADGGVAPDAAIPSPADGTVRFYHGGDEPTSGGARWVSTDPAYARNFRGPNDVHYVDVLADHPDVLAARLWDENNPDMAGRYAHFEVPEDVARGFLPYRGIGPLSQRLEMVGPEARETALRGAVAARADGEPVRVADALDAMDAARYADLARTDPRLGEWTEVRDLTASRLAERETEVEHFRGLVEARTRGEAPADLANYGTAAAVDAALRGREAGLAGLRGRLAAIEHGLEQLHAGRDPGFALRYDDPGLNRPAGIDAPGAMPQTMMSRIRELGGLQDSGGELAARDLDKTPGLVRRSGLTLDRAAQQLADEGYLPSVAQDRAGNGPDRVSTVDELLEAIDQHQSGRPRLREQDIAAWDALVTRHGDAVDGLRGAADFLGIPDAQARGLSRGQVADLLKRKAIRDQDGFGLDAVDELPGWDEPITARTPAELAADMDRAMDAMRSPPEDRAAAADERAVTTVTDRAPKLDTPDKALVEAQQAADAAIARVQVEAAAGRLPEDSLARINDASALAEGDAKAYEAAGACLAARGL